MRFCGLYVLHMKETTIWRAILRLIFKCIQFHSACSTCFQIITADSNYGTKEAETIFNDETNNQLKNVYEKYGVEAVQVSEIHLSRLVQITVVSLKVMAFFFILFCVALW